MSGSESAWQEKNMSDEFIVVDTVSGRGMAEMLRSYLQAQGVQCELSQEALGTVYGMTIAPLGSVELLVPSHQGKQARELIKDYHRSNKELGK
jgi:hypothetical protein